MAFYVSALARAVPHHPPLTRSDRYSPQRSGRISSPVLFGYSGSVGKYVPVAFEACYAALTPVSQYDNYSFLLFLVVLVAVFCLSTISCPFVSRFDSLCLVLLGEIGRGLRPRREHGHRDGYHQRQEHPEKAVLYHRHRLDSHCGHRHRHLRHDKLVGV